MFLLFYGDTYYPKGGSLDFKGKFDSVDEAKQKFIDKYSDPVSSIDVWADIVDSVSFDSVAYGEIYKQPSKKRQVTWFSSAKEANL